MQAKISCFLNMMYENQAAQVSLKNGQPHSYALAVTSPQ